jgi:GTP:adenosylcobinamide-phosphate guanylyltransferase
MAAEETEQHVAKRDFTAIVLAGERASPAADPLASAAGVASKVLVPVAGVAVIQRVLDNIERCDRFNRRILVGPTAATLAAVPGLLSRIDSGVWTWLAPSHSPAASSSAALEIIGSNAPVLLTTADHAFMTAEILDYFCSAAVSTGADFAVGFARRRDVLEMFPGTRRTGWRFSDDTYCGCNLFAVLQPAGHSVSAFWQRVETERKRPWRIMQMLGMGLFLRYMARRLTLADALDELGNRTRCRIAPVVLSQSEAAVDVDSVDDWRLVNETWARLRG